jgi:predicted GNAT family acetyltransferase
MTTELRHEPDQNRYTFWVDDDEVGLTDYRVHDGTIDIVHTEIDPSRRRGGLGADMVGRVLDDIRTTRTERVLPSCPFVARFVREHPDYDELLSR